MAEPLRADFHIGLDPAHDSRVAELIPPEVSPHEAPDIPLGSILARMMEGYHHTCLEPQTSARRRIRPAPARASARDRAPLITDPLMVRRVDGFAAPQAEAGV